MSGHGATIGDKVTASDKATAGNGVTEAHMLGDSEIRKDAIQAGVESAAIRVGHIATIITGAVRDVANEIGEFATDMFEVVESSRRARADREPGTD